MTNVLALEAIRQKARRKANEQETTRLGNTPYLSEKLKSLAEDRFGGEPRGKNSRKYSTPDTRSIYFNPAFSVEPNNVIASHRRPSVDNAVDFRTVTSLKSMCASNPHLLEDEPDNSKVPTNHNQFAHQKMKGNEKRIYITQPLKPRRASADNQSYVTIFSSETPNSAQCVSQNAQRNVNYQNERLVKNSVRRRCPSKEPFERMTPLDRSRRVMSYPSPAYESWHDELKYWRAALSSSSKLQALKK